MVFVLGAVGDGIWHEVFGVEVDIEALLSPTHLLLLIGGFLMVTSPLRAAAADDEAGWPQVITLTLAAALVSFFTMYISALDHPAGIERFATGTFRELTEIEDLAGIFATNLILIGASLYLAQRWRARRGAFVILFAGVALAMTGLHAFDNAHLIVPALIAGAVFDALVATRLVRTLSAGLASLVLWLGYFAVVDIVDGVTWSPELWLGATVLATATSVLLATLMSPRPRPAA